MFRFRTRLTTIYNERRNSLLPSCRGAVTHVSYLCSYFTSRKYLWTRRKALHVLPHNTQATTRITHNQGRVITSNWRRFLSSRCSRFPRQDHAAAADPARDSGPANSHPLLRLCVVPGPADRPLNAAPERHEDRLERKGDQPDGKPCSSEVFGERKRRRSGGRLEGSGLACVCQVRREKPWEASPLSLSYANTRLATRLTSMYRPCRTVSLVWAWVWAWCGVPAGVLGAAAIPPGLTTEAHIFTGPTTTTPPPPAPPEDFTVTYKDVFASFVHLTFSYNATFNLTKVSVPPPLFITVNEISGANIASRIA
ncbi:hypothetical protein E2C01_001706 [Portunus trituberculatus]|uniref:Uncharacterized protein n=1 Tax=Portunus trituberculatus TaxID=210409 RepID=A0A5B7CN60_PORTR|nr:hypothetical protein [Portunus trituberculatus]